MSTPTNNQSNQNTIEEKKTFLEGLLKDIKAPTLESISHWSLYISIYITIFILFHAAFESAWDDFAVKPVLSKLSTGGIYKDISIVFITLLLVIYLFATKRMIETRTIELFAYIIILSAYIFYRFKSDFWHFTTLHCCKTFYYADFPAFIILIKTIIAIILAILKWIPKNNSDIKKPSSSEEVSPFQIDAPIKNTNDDDLGYGDYAKNLAQRILVTNADQGSFAIGVNATWGSGKTSFIEILRKELGEKDIIHIKFNPWDSHSPNKIIQDFFETLQTEFDNQIHSSLPKKLAAYSNKLINLNDDNTIVQYLQMSVSVITGYDSIESLFNDINDTIESSGKKIIIYIDDLDRLDNAEIVEVLKLVRNTANFKNTFFVVAYDRAYVVNAIGEHNLHDKEAFLSKIFQLEVNLPLIDELVIVDNLWSLLKSYFNSNKANFVSPEILTTWLTNMRDVKRLYNSFTLNISELKEKVNMQDFLLIELLRLRDPELYASIAKRKFLKKENDFWIIETKQIINQEKNVQHLLKMLFNKRNNRHNSIARIYSFHYYFYYNLRKTDIELVEFESALDINSLSELKQRVQTWIEDGKYVSLKEHLIRALKDEKGKLKQLLAIILNYTSLLDSNGNKLSFDITKVVDILYDETVFPTHISRENLINIFVNNNTEHWHTLADLLYSSLNQVNNMTTLSSSDADAERLFIHDAAFTVLESYKKFSDKRVDMQTVFILAATIMSVDNSEQVKNKINKVFSDLVKKDTDSFILWCLSKDKIYETAPPNKWDVIELCNITLFYIKENNKLYPQSQYLDIISIYTNSTSPVDFPSLSDKKVGNPQQEQLSKKFELDVSHVSRLNAERRNNLNIFKSPTVILP